MIFLIFALVTGPVGDYLGYDYDFSLIYQGFDSLYSIIGDEGDTIIYDTITVIDTLTYGGYAAYLNRHIRISDLWMRSDTLFSWENEDTLFTYISRDTVFQRTYITPFYTGLQWDLGITGETLIIDIDNDNIEDTLIVQSGVSEVLDSVVTTVPLGTFGTFNISSTMNLCGWQSLLGDSCRIWIRDWQWLSPNTGVVRDSIVIIDTVRQYVWFELLRYIMYSEAIDSGYAGITEARTVTKGPVQSILNGIRISESGHYFIDIYDVTGRWITDYNIYIDSEYKLRPVLTPGVYFARVMHESGQISIKFLIID